MRVARVAVGMVVLGLAGAGGAVAAPPAPIDTGAYSRFALAGDHLLLFDSERPALAVRDPDGTVRVLHRAPRSRGIAPGIAEVAATASQVAFLTDGFETQGEGGVRWTSLRAGPLDGPFDLVAGSEGGRRGATPHDAEITESGLLFSDERGVALRPADGSATVRLGGTGFERLAASGRYAATRTSQRAAVIDLQTRTEVARVAVASEPTGNVTPSAGVAADGTLLYVDAQRRLWSLIPSTGQRTLLMRGAHAVAHVAGRTAYVVTRTGSGQFEALQRLWAVDLDGGEPRPVTESLFGAEFVTDGARVVYRRGECTLYGDLPAAETAPVAAGCSPQAFSFFVNERQRGGKVRMRVTCPGGTADRCTGTARLTAKRANGRGRVHLGTWRFAAAGGQRVAGTIAVRRPLRRRTVARLRITGSPYGTVRRRIVLGGGP